MCDTKKGGLYFRVKHNNIRRQKLSLVEYFNMFAFFYYGCSLTQPTAKFLSAQYKLVAECGGKFKNFIVLYKYIPSLFCRSWHTCRFICLANTNI